MTMHEANEKYLVMTEEAQNVINEKAVRHLPCSFCGSRAGQPCTIQLYDRARGQSLPTVITKDGKRHSFSHKCRHLEYIMNEDVIEMLGDPEPDLSDML